jgi:hypothetical protein
VSIPETAITKRPTFKLNVLAQAVNLDKFLAAFDSVLAESKNVEVEVQGSIRK